MIRPPRLLAEHWPSPISRRFPLSPTPRGSRRLAARPPRAAFRAAQTLPPTARIGPVLGLLMDPTAPVPGSAADADAEAEANGYEDAAEFEDAEAGGGDDAGPGAAPAGGGEEVRELPEELAKGVVCLECETSAEAAAAGVGGTCRVYVVGTAHVSQVSWC